VAAPAARSTDATDIVGACAIGAGETLTNVAADCYYMTNHSPGTGGTHSARTLSTLARATEVVELLIQSDGATAAEVADHLDMSRSSVYNYLSTMLDAGWLVKEGREYALSLRFFQIGAFVRTSSPLFETARPELDRLADDTGETTHLSTEEHNCQIHLYKAHGEKAVGSEYHRFKLHAASHLHETATGKAILSRLPRRRVEEILDEHGLPGKTEHTITDRAALFEELDRTAERGYALNEEEEILGLRAVGAPIVNRDGAVLGSISLSGPTSRLRGERFREEVPELIKQTANVIELDLNMENRLSSGDHDVGEGGDERV
jgi:DNA-binding IclR family transcriptional regulator